MQFILLLLYNVFAFFDRIIAWAIAECYNLIITLSSASVLDNDVVKQFSQRISVLLGMIMVFWLAFRIIKYVIDPDLTSDKSQGFGKIIVNVVVMLTMLVLVNYAFTFAFKFQNIFIESNVMMKVIFGVSGETDNPVEENSQMGNEMAYYLYSAFIRPSDNLSKCRNFYGLDPDGINKCADQIQDRSSKSIRATWVQGNNAKDVSRMLSANIVSAKEGDDFLFSYTPIISTVCGIIMLMLLVSFAVDIAIRVVKLAFLQIIAPVPIISYIDPNSGKNGIFKNWFKTVSSTYVSLFVRLIAIYFTVFLISYAAKGEIILGYENNQPVYATLQNEPFVIVLVIIGSLMFAKNLPKLLSEIFGINIDGGGMFGSMLKKGQAMGKRGLHGLGAAGLGAIGGAAAGAYAGFRTGLDDKKGFLHAAFKGVGKSITTSAGSAGRGMIAGVKSNKTWSAAGSAIARSNASRNANALYKEAGGYGYGSRIEDQFNEWAGYQNSSGEINSMEKELKRLNTDIENNNSKENALRMAAAGVISDSGMTGEELLKINSNYGAYAQAKETMSEYLKSTNLSDEAYAKGMARWEKSYFEQNEQFDFDKVELAKKYASLDSQIQAIDADTYNKRNDAKKYQRALDARTDMRKKGK